MDIQTYVNFGTWTAPSPAEDSIHFPTEEDWASVSGKYPYRDNPAFEPDDSSLLGILQFPTSGLDPDHLPDDGSDLLSGHGYDLEQNMYRFKNLDVGHHKLDGDLDLVPDHDIGKNINFNPRIDPGQDLISTKGLNSQALTSTMSTTDSFGDTFSSSGSSLVTLTDIETILKASVLVATSGKRTHEKTSSKGIGKHIISYSSVSYNLQVFS